MTASLAEPGSSLARCQRFSDLLLLRIEIKKVVTEQRRVTAPPLVEISKEVR